MLVQWQLSRIGLPGMCLNIGSRVGIVTAAVVAVTVVSVVAAFAATAPVTVIVAAVVFDATAPVTVVISSVAAATVFISSASFCVL